MSPETRALHLRLNPDGARPSVSPLVQSSAFEAGSPYFYARKDHPNTAELEAVVAHLEGAAGGVAFSSGMAAISAVLELLSTGDTLVVNRLLYGCSLKHFQRTCTRIGVRLVVTDLGDPDWAEALAGLDRVRMVFFETPTNPFLRTIDVGAVRAALRARNLETLVVVDNTWATPLFQHPLAWGADISLHSGTKYLGGHSDVMSGICLANRPDLLDALRAARFYSGAVLDAHAAWLVRRSLQTLAIRVRHQASTTRAMCEVLRGLPAITHVYYPEIDGKQLVDYAGIVFVELRADLGDAYPRLIDGLEFFGTGTGMACVTSMVAQPYSGSHASLTDSEKAEMGLRRNLVRLCFGLEDPADIRDVLVDAFGRLSPSTQASP